MKPGDKALRQVALVRRLAAQLVQRQRQTLQGFVVVGINAVMRRMMVVHTAT
jgi:hypothetical protein